MEDSNKQEEVLGYELDEQMDVLLRKVEKHVFNPHYLEDGEKRDLENLVSLVRQELMSGAITQSTLDKRKWLTPDEVAVKVEAAKTEAFEAGLQEGIAAAGHRKYGKSAYITTAGREALGALEDKVNDPECKRSNAEIDAVIEKQIQTGDIPLSLKKKVEVIWEALGALEDRVTDMETRMLGTSLSPRDWEEGE